MTTAVIVQARLGSNRLPGKVMKRLAGKSVLEHVLRRCQAIAGADVVCCATVEGPDGDVIGAEAERLGAAVYKGSEHDVLDRYYQAARMLGADVVLRVTSDCPLIDAAVCAQVLDLRAREAADFACNNMPPAWPHGLDCEAYAFAALELAAENATDPFEREHVGPWIRAHPSLKTVSLPGPGGPALDHRWTLDYPEDLEFFERLFALLPDSGPRVGMQTIIDVLDQHPEVMAINSRHHH